MTRTNKVLSTREKAERRTLKIGEVSKMSGVGIEALRFYEKMGLLGAPARSMSGYRHYSPDVIERLEFIHRAQVLGFSLAEIATLIAEKDSGQHPCSEVRAIVRRRLEELDEQMKEMRRYRKELATALKEWEEAGDKPGHVCGLIEGTTLKHRMPQSKGIERKKR